MIKRIASGPCTMASQNLLILLPSRNLCFLEPVVADPHLNSFALRSQVSLLTLKIPLGWRTSRHPAIAAKPKGSITITYKLVIRRRKRPFLWTILFVDTLLDSTGVVSRIRELGLSPYVVHEVVEVADKDKCPRIDTIVVD